MSSFEIMEVEGFGLDVDMCPVGLKDAFVMTPFSVLDAKSGEWQQRKKAWISIGIDSEVGRGNNLLKQSKASMGVLQSQEFKLEYQRRGKAIKEGKESAAGVLFKSQDGLNKIMNQRGTQKRKADGNWLTFRMGLDEYRNKGKSKGKAKITGTSIFDPVLCELSYRWWCPTQGRILDPFCGGSVRGIVAAMLDREYKGIDLRQEQVDANIAQWEALKLGLGAGKPDPKWVVGDSTCVRQLVEPGEKFDMVYSCPPYGDLEVYSKNEADLSNMSHEKFMEMYRAIIKRSCSLLKEDRFAVFVVGDFRCKKTGFQRNFVSDTIQAFLDAGMSYYNECILLTMIGSLPIRTGKFFRKSRKLGKTHQNVLVFYKGNPDNIEKNFTEF